MQDRIVSLTFSLLLHIGALLFLSRQLQIEPVDLSSPELNAPAVELTFEAGDAKGDGAGGESESASARKHDPLPSVEKSVVYPEPAPVPADAEPIAPLEAVKPVPSHEMRPLDIPMLPPAKIDAREIPPTSDEREYEAALRNAAAEAREAASAEQASEGEAQGTAHANQASAGDETAGGKSGSGGGNGIYAYSPRPFRPIKPVYPYAARRRGEEGTVKLRVAVSPRGVPESISVITSSGFPLLDKAASSAASAARFHPAQREGEPIAGVVVITLVFRISKNP